MKTHPRTSPRIPRRPGWTLLSTCILLIASAATTYARPLPPRGFDAPAIHLKDLEGIAHTVKADEHKTLILVFGDAGHEGTRKACNDIADSLDDTRIDAKSVESFLITASDAATESIKDAAKLSHYPSTILRDPQRDTFSTFHIVVIPTIVVIDTKGKVLHATPGFVQRFKDIITSAVLVSQGKATIESLDQLIATKGEEQINPDDARATRLIHLGHELMRHRMFDTAQERFSEAMKLRPDNVEAMRGLGDVLIRKAKHADAVAVLRSALAKSPESSAVQLSLAEAKLGLATQADANEAERLIKGVLSNEPKNARSHYLMGKLLEAANHQSDALSEYRTAAELLLESQATP